jgi:type IV secretory pathway VirB2 component (pilin)
MRESLLRRRGPKRYSDPKPQRSTSLACSTGPRAHGRVWVSRTVAVLTAALLLPAAALAQSPWERAAGNLEQTFTGPLARSLALVAIVLGGLMFMFGEAGAKRQISGIVFGGGLALFAAQFLTWLF